MRVEHKAAKTTLTVGAHIRQLSGDINNYKVLHEVYSVGKTCSKEFRSSLTHERRHFPSSHNQRPAILEIAFGTSKRHGCALTCSLSDL